MYIFWVNLDFINENFIFSENLNTHFPVNLDFILKISFFSENLNLTQIHDEIYSFK